MFKVDAKGLKNISFKHADKFISSLELVKTNNRLACVGFYGKKDESKINGACLFNLNPESLKMETTKFNPFTETFLTDKYGNSKRKKKKSKKKGLKNIDFKRFCLRQRRHKY